MDIKVVLGFWWTLIVANFWKSTKTQIKLKTQFFENRWYTFLENATVLPYPKSHRKILMFGEAGAPESSFCDWKLRDY